MNSSTTSRPDITGFILVYKPPGLSSFAVVKRVRYLTNVKKVGHAGTLDPFAEGLLIIAIGRNATKNISTFVNFNKEYEFTVKLGQTTATLDPESDISHETPVADSVEEQFPNVLNEFIGTYDQLPPDFSAKKINGKKAYELARKGHTVELKPVPVTIHSLHLIDQNCSEHCYTIRMTCSKGTYVRSFARDIAERVKTVGYVTWLKRTAIGPYSFRQALDFDSLSLESIKGAMFNTEHD